MNRRQFLIGSGAAPTWAQRSGRRPSGRPNVLLLFADQFRYDAMGCAGNTVVRTPCLDELARSGMRFTHALTPTPVCVAARMSLITGQRAAHTHWMSNSKLPGPVPVLPTLMQTLEEAGYRTHAAGKMHFHGLHYGLNRLDSMEEICNHRCDDDYLMFLKERRIRTRNPQGIRDLLYFQPQTSGLDEPVSQNAWVADRSVHFLREHARYRKGRPFFLWSSWTAPHPPFAPCEPYASMYEPGNMPLPVYVDRPIATLPSPAWKHRARLDGAHLDPDRIRRIKALYYGQVSHVDAAIGRVLSELEQLGLADNTVVVFSSDHGEMMGDHGLSQKFVPYEASVRVPLLMRWSGHTAAGQVSSDLVATTDLLPTFLSAAGIEYPGDAQQLAGTSLLSGRASRRNAFFVDYGQGSERWISVRTRRHKYALWAAGGAEELYDLDSDPQERHNLALADPALAAEFRARAIAWEKENGLASSFESGRWRVFVEPKPPEHTPREVVLNDGDWPDNLPADEKDMVESYAEAFTRAIAKETTLAPEKLSLRQYKEKGGTPLLGTPWEEAWKRA